MVLAGKGAGAKKLHLRESCLRYKLDWTLLVNMVQNIGAKHWCKKTWSSQEFFFKVGTQLGLSDD